MEARGSIEDAGCIVTVRFTPTATGVREGLITAHRDALPTELPVIIAGEGLANTDLAVSVDARRQVPLGDDVVMRGVITNHGPPGTRGVG
jgi:hypothetical protein